MSSDETATEPDEGSETAGTDAGYRQAATGTQEEGPQASDLSQGPPDARDSRPHGEEVVRIRGLSKRYGTFAAVEDLNVSLKRGEVFGLLGPNGAGKTTTILMLLGLSEPTSGTISVAGYDPTRNALEVKRRVGYLPDAVGFYEGISGRANLAFSAELAGIPATEAQPHLEELLDRVGLSEAADAKVSTYSRGMRQRLGIADVLVSDPDVVILDEPTVAIDPEGVAEMLAVIRSLAADSGVAVLLASHLLEQVQSVCDRVGIFVRGRMVAQGQMEELAERLTSGAVTIEVGVADDLDAAERTVARIDGVRSIERAHDGGPIIAAHADGDLRGEVADALARDGHQVLHLRRRSRQLDQLYREYFQASEREARRGAGN